MSPYYHPPLDITKWVPGIPIRRVDVAVLLPRGSGFAFSQVPVLAF
jgi:hypothetical protein